VTFGGLAHFTAFGQPPGKLRAVIVSLASPTADHAGNPVLSQAMTRHR